MSFHILSTPGELLRRLPGRAARVVTHELGWIFFTRVPSARRAVEGILYFSWGLFFLVVVFLFCEFCMYSFWLAWYSSSPLDEGTPSPSPVVLWFCFSFVSWPATPHKAPLTFGGRVELLVWVALFILCCCCCCSSFVFVFRGLLVFVCCLPRFLLLDPSVVLVPVMIWSHRLLAWICFLLTCYLSWAVFFLCVLYLRLSGVLMISNVILMSLRPVGLCVV